MSRHHAGRRPRRPPKTSHLIGLAGGLTCFYVMLTVKQRFRIDDAPDVFAARGMRGPLLPSVFALPSLSGIEFSRG